jgi:hypothetical protein
LAYALIGIELHEEAEGELDRTKLGPVLAISSLTSARNSAR